MFQKVSVQLVSVYSEAFYSSTDHKSGAILVTKTTINTAMTTTAAKTTSPLGCIIAILLKRICCWGAVCDSPLRKDKREKLNFQAFREKPKHRPVSPGLLR